MKNVLVIDSGLGGRIIYERLLNDFPQSNFVLYQDSINSPYGNKTIKELFILTKSLLDNLIEKYKPYMIIFACNTISSSILNKIKNEYKDIVVLGMSPLDVINKNEKTLIISTVRTKKAIKKYYKDDNICVISFKSLAKNLEYNYVDIQKEKEYVLRVLKQKVFVPQKVIIGCTHYCLLEGVIRYFYHNKIVVDDGYNKLKEKLKKYLNNF